jgi:hypothetical protein
MFVIIIMVVGGWLLYRDWQKRKKGIPYAHVEVKYAKQPEPEPKQVSYRPSGKYNVSWR